MKKLDAMENSAGEAELKAAVVRGRKLLNKRALMAAAAGAVPIPGLDWVVDAALLSRLIPEINKEFGLTPDQIQGLDSRSREQVQKAVAVVGSALIGRLMTKEAALAIAKALGVRLTVARAARFAPMVGQAIAAVAGYAAIRYFGEKHIQDCEKVLRLAAKKPAPVRGLVHKPARGVQ